MFQSSVPKPSSGLRDLDDLRSLIMFQRFRVRANVCVVGAKTVKILGGLCLAARIRILRAIAAMVIMPRLIRGTLGLQSQVTEW